MRRPLARELDDIFAKVRLDHMQTRLFQCLVEMDLFGGHRLALDDALHASVACQAADDTAGCRAVGCPVNMPAGGFNLRGESLEMLVQMRERGCTRGAGAVTGDTAADHLLHAVSTRDAEPGRGTVEGNLQAL